MNRHTELIQFVLDAAESVPLQKRARLFRALADICGDQLEQISLQNLAADMEAADARCREFMFRFNQKTSSITP